MPCELVVYIGLDSASIECFGLGLCLVRYWRSRRAFPAVMQITVLVTLAP